MREKESKGIRKNRKRRLIGNARNQGNIDQLSSKNLNYEKKRGILKGPFSRVWKEFTKKEKIFCWFKEANTLRKR